MGAGDPEYILVALRLNPAFGHVFARIFGTKRHAIVDEVISGLPRTRPLHRDVVALLRPHPWRRPNLESPRSLQFFRRVVPLYLLTLVHAVDEFDVLLHSLFHLLLGAVVGCLIITLIITHLHMCLFSSTEVQRLVPEALPVDAGRALRWVECHDFELGHFVYKLTCRFHLLKQCLVAPLHVDNELHLLVESFTGLEV